MSGTRTPWTLTVRDALELDIFTYAQSTVVAGEQHLDNIIRWVHSSEIADIAGFLAGGELLLTAGFGLGRTQTTQRAFVRSVAGAGVAALAIELSGRVFRKMPAAVVSEADAVGLPVIAFDREVPFVEVAHQVHDCIVDLRVKELMEDEIATAAFTSLILQGEDHLSMVEELARRLGHPCVLEDRAHQMRAYYGRTEASDGVVADWDGHSREIHDPASSTSACTRETVAIKGQEWGWLHVLHPGASLSRPDIYAVGRATAATAITLLSDQVRGARRSQRHAALINRLIMGDITGEGFIERAMKMGRDLRRKSFIVVVAAPHHDSVFGEPQLTECVELPGATALVADSGDQLLAVVALPAKRGEKAIIDALRDAPARIGLSRIVPPAQLRLAIQQANNAYAAAAGADHPVRFDDLGVLRLLVALAQGPELASYVDDELGKVLEHDGGSVNKLFPTLRIFLECDGHKSEAAAKLFVQRRTLYYRLDRLSALLGMSLDDPATRQRLLLAVRGLELLNQRPVGPHAQGLAF